MRWIVPSLAAAALAFALPASATVLYSTGFEAPGFAPGGLNGQGGWVVDTSAGDASDADEVTVEDSFAFSGGQAVELDNPVGVRSVYYGYGPITPTGSIVVSMEVYDNSPDILTQFDVTGVAGIEDTAAGVQFGYSGGATNDLTAFSNGGDRVIGTFTPGTWVDVSMTLNYATQTYSVSIDGALAASGLQFCGALGDECNGSPISQFGDVVFYSPSSHGGELYLDDLSIDQVPEPDAWALFIAGAALAGATLRARRRAAA
jgi:hypothetical protein